MLIWQREAALLGQVLELCRGDPHQGVLDPRQMMCLGRFDLQEEQIICSRLSLESLKPYKRDTGPLLELPNLTKGIENGIKIC